MQEEIKGILGDVLHLGERVSTLDTDTPLLGNIPELDSMAVVNIITSIEDYYGFTVDDDDVSAETFETVGSLVDFVKEKISNN